MSSEKKLLMGIMAFVAVLIVARISLFFRSFKKELHYINGEIDRTVGGEHERWKRARKRLYLSLIPFYNPYKKKKKRTHR